MTALMLVTFLGLATAIGFWATEERSPRMQIGVTATDASGEKKTQQMAGKAITAVQLKKNRLVVTTTAGRYTVAGLQMELRYPDDVTPRPGITVTWLEEGHDLEGDVSSIHVTSDEVRISTTKSKSLTLKRAPDQTGTLTIK